MTTPPPADPPHTAGRPPAGVPADARRPAPAAPPAADPARYRALVVTASNRAAAGVYPDKGGPLLVDGLSALGLSVDGPRVVPDGDPVRDVLREAVAAAYDVVVTTGGTGISPTDLTPEATREVLDYEIPGIPEALRAEGLPKVPTAALSRGLAGVAGTTLIVNLPGSSGGVRDGLAVLARLLPHALDQLRGGDHRRPDTPATGEPAAGVLAPGVPAGGAPVVGVPVAGGAIANGPAVGGAADRSAAGGSVTGGSAASGPASPAAPPAAPSGPSGGAPDEPAGRER